MKFTADFHIHSKYSRATSKDMDLDHISKWAKLKGIDLMGTGDFTHPLWLAELKKKLRPDDGGLFDFNGTKFILTTEVCNIFHQNGKLRKVHTMIFAPSLKVVEKINLELGRLANLMSDGRPIFTFPVKKLAEIALTASPDCLVIPCHAWTPWFSIFGSMSGFDSIEECFEEYSRNIFAIETGLSSDPAMNWRLSGLDRLNLISNSDAHSPSKIGREANIFDTELTYKGVYDALKKKDPKKFLMTVEFFPEEGKYHYDGHRTCQVRLSPKETKSNNKKCPKCGRVVTVGVMNRIDELADREEGFVLENAIPFRSLIPLQEIIAEILDKGVDTISVKNEYMKMINTFGSELGILLDTPLDSLARLMPERTVEGVKRVREGKINILPGYDGEYGKISIFNGEAVKKKVQMGLF
ncbi:MAG: endonuclease Q family protein [Candidatus Saganbacteria bacterium]|nr:endonuclease Q family protein [Candidatus Saganbacteria bacterium]